jgi:hypothetical protein
VKGIDAPDAQGQKLQVGEIEVITIRVQGREQVKGRLKKCVTNKGNKGRIHW